MERPAFICSMRWSATIRAPSRSGLALGVLCCGGPRRSTRRWGRSHHLDEKRMQRYVEQAAASAGTLKSASVRTLRHPFAPFCCKRIRTYASCRSCSDKATSVRRCASARSSSPSASASSGTAYAACEPMHDRLRTRFRACWDRECVMARSERGSVCGDADPRAVGVRKALRMSAPEA